MNVIITDTGFSRDDWTKEYRTLTDQPANDCTCAIDLAADTDPAALTGLNNATMIRIDFPSSADGRGFSLAAILRSNGYTGRLRARGHILADQYAMARRSGFNEVEINADLAARQPEAQWLARANWQSHNYQARLRG